MVLHGARNKVVATETDSFVHQTQNTWSPDLFSNDGFPLDFTLVLSSIFFNIYQNSHLILTKNFWYFYRQLIL